MVTVEKEINNNIVLDHQFNLTQNQIKHWYKKHIALCQPALGCWKWASLIKTFGWHVLAASGTCSNRWKMCHSLLLNCWPRGIVQNKYWVDLMEYKDWMGFHQAHHSSSHLIDFQGRTWFVVVCVFFLFGNNGTELTKLEETYRITKQICRNPTPPKTISTWTGWPDQDDIYRKWKSCHLLLGHSKSFLFLVTGTFDLCSCTRKGRLGSILNPSEFSGPAGRSGKKLWESKTWSVSSLCWEVSREETCFLTRSFCSMDCSFLQEVSSYYVVGSSMWMSAWPWSFPRAAGEICSGAWSTSCPLLWLQWL